MRAAREIITGLLLVLSLAGCGGGGGGGGGGDSVDPPSSVATLADLALSAGDLDQVFQSDRFVYTATVGFLTTVTTVTPTTTDAAATVTVNGVAVTSGSASAPIPLTVGANTLTVIVTAEDGVSTSTYTVTVTRESRSSVATLANLELSAGSLEQTFQSSLFDYTATVGFLTTATTVTPTTTDAAATVTVNGVAVTSGSASAPIPLAVGENTLTVIVTAEDGVSTSTYTVTVTRESASEFAQQAYIKGSNPGVGDQFGYSIALSGDTLAVGAYNEQSGTGAVYVFIRSGTTWSPQAYIKASNAGSDDFFGSSVALSGDTLVVGAYREQSNANVINGDESDNSLTEAGAVYVFTRSGVTWSQQAYIKPSNTGDYDRFGWSVALSGETLAVGAPQDPIDISLADSGAVYLFIRSGTKWSPQAYIKASNPDVSDSFGYSVALFGDTLAVGAKGEDSNANGIQQGSPADPNNNDTQNSGAVYMFTRGGVTWTQQAYIKASNPGINNVFGWSLALHGETLVVGAPFEASTITNSGAVYVYIYNGASWTPQSYVKTSNPGENDTFGWSVALSDDTLAVGAKGNQANAGAVYLFTRSGTIWSQQDYVKPVVNDGGDYFGYSVALSGDTLAAGAPGEDSKATGVDGDALDNSQSGSGAAYVFQ